MSRRGNRQKKSLHHGAVEKELRSLHEKGVHVERQRDLIRTLLNALVCQQSSKVKLSKQDFENARGGKCDIEQTGDDEYTVTFIPGENTPLTVRRRTFWQWLRDLFRRPKKADV